MKSLAEAVFDWAREQPDKTALIYNDVANSYRWLADGIAVARGAFVDEGVRGPGVAVVAISNLVDFWAASLALRSLGLTCVMIPGPDDVTRLGVPDVRLVVTTVGEIWPGLEQACAQAGFPLLTSTLRTQRPLGLADGPQLPPGGVALLTSGTTGVFKKVLTEPSFEAEFMQRRWEIIRADRDSTVAVFDLVPWSGTGYRNPAAAWFAGATVVMDQDRPPHLCLRHPGITHATIIPPKLAQILAEPDGAFPRSEMLRLSVTSGTITRAQVERTKARITPHLFNWLGATESQITGHTRLDTPDDQRWHRVLRSVQVVDEDDRPVVPGQTGRLRVSTAGGPKEYWCDPAATAEFFRDGYFYPGDLALTRADGRIALQGRATSIINVGGQKLSPEPIEDQLREALGLSGACLVSLQNLSGVEELHLVLETPAPLPLDQIAPALRAATPGWGAVQVHFTSLLPRNVLGKVMRKALTEELLAAVRPAGAAQP